MKTLHKNLILAVLVLFSVCSLLIAGYNYNYKARIELYVNQLFFKDFNDVFLKHNETIIYQFDAIYETRRVSIKTLAQINEEAKEIVSYLDELTKSYNELYRNSDNILSISNEYKVLMHSVIYSETLKLLENSRSDNKNEILIPDQLFKHFNDVQLKEKLFLAQEVINKFKDEHQPYLKKLESESGRNFIKDAYWLKLINELNNQVSNYKYKNS